MRTAFALTASTGLAALIAGCTIYDPPAVTPPRVQIEVSDPALDFAASMEVRSLVPGLRVGWDVGSGDRRAAELPETLEGRIALIALDDGSVVPTTIADTDGYEVYTLDGELRTDNLGPPREPRGHAVIPTEPLPDGWYALVVGLDVAHERGITDIERPRSFSNLERGDALAARFHIGELTTVGQLSVACGAPLAFDVDGPEGWDAACQVVVQLYGTDAGSVASEDVFVLYDGVAAECVPADGTAAGRPLRGVVCEQPPDGTLVSAGSTALDDSLELVFDTVELRPLPDAPPGTLGVSVSRSLEQGLEVLDAWILARGW